MFDRLGTLTLPFLPSRAASQIGHAPHWAPSLVIIIAMHMILELVAHPLRVEHTLARIPGSATQAELAVVREDLDTALPWDLAILPINEAAAATAGALVLGLIVAAFGTTQRPRFVLLFTLGVGLAGIGVIEKGAEIAFLSMGGPVSAVPPFPWSAMAFMERAGVSYPVGLLLTMINLFTLWYVSALARALAVLCNISKAQAVLIAIVFRAVTAGCAIAVLHLLRNAYVFTF